MTEKEKTELFDKWYDENYDEWAEGEEGIALREELEQAFKGGITELENKIADIKANCDLAIEGRDIKIKELEQEVEKHKWNDIFLEDCAGYDKKIAEEYTTLQERIKELEQELTVEKDLHQEEVNLHLHAEEYIKSLEKEIKELKKNYEDSLVACGVLKSKIDILTQPSPLESMQDALVTTQKVAYEKQKKQLTKAKELLAKWVELFKPKGGNIPPTPIQIDTEQFIKEIEK